MGAVYGRLAVSLILVGALMSACPGRAPKVFGPEERVTVFIVGDSVAAGFSAGRADATLVHHLASFRPEWFIVNYSTGGASMGARPERRGLDASAVLPMWPSVVVIMLGTNDFGFGVPLDEFRAAYDTFLGLIFDFYRPTVVCVTPLRQLDETGPNRVGTAMTAYRDAIRDVCGARGAGVVDGRELLPFEPRYFSDRLQIHPNMEGYAIMARNFAMQLDRYLSRHDGHGTPASRRSQL